MTNGRDDTREEVVDDTREEVADDTREEVADDTREEVVDGTREEVVDDTREEVVDGTREEVVDDQASVDGGADGTGPTRGRRGGGVTDPGSADRPGEDQSTAMLSGEYDSEEWVDLGDRATPQSARAGHERPSGEELSNYVTERRSLSSLVQLQWALRVVVGAVVVGLVGSFGLSRFGIDPRYGGALLFGLVVLGSLWVVGYYRLWVYQIREDAIYLERGVVTHVRTLVPYVRIQHVDTSRSPLERLFGLSTLVVYTAGSRGADVSIPGLTPDEARNLQNRVKALATEAEGGDAL